MSGGIVVRYAQEIPVPSVDEVEAIEGEQGVQGEQGEQGLPGEPGAGGVELPPQNILAASGAIELDLAVSRNFRLRLTGDVTLSVIGMADGVKFTVSVTQNGIAGWDVTWWPDIRWARGGTPPVITPTAIKRDTFGFECWVVSGEPLYYDGFVIGQNI